MQNCSGSSVHLRIDRFSKQSMRGLFHAGAMVLLCWLSVLTFFSRQIDELFNADVLFAEEFLQAMHQGQTISGYFFPPPGFIFPDLLLYFSLRLIGLPFSAAIPASALLSIGLLCFALRRLARHACMHPADLTISSLLPFSLLLLLLFNGILFLALLHHGIQASMAIFFLAVHIEMLQKPQAGANFYPATKQSRANILSAALIGLAIAFDPLLWLWYFAPALLLLLYYSFEKRNLCLQEGAMLILSLVCAMIARRLAEQFFFLPAPFANAWPFMDDASGLPETIELWQAVLKNFQALARDLQEFPALWPVLLLALSGFIRSYTRTGRLHLALALAQGMLFLLLAVWKQNLAARYFWPLFIQLSFLSGLELFFLTQKVTEKIAKARPWLALSGLILIACVGFLILKPDFSKKQKPALARCLEKICKKRKCKTGMASYWQARPATLWSGIPVLPVNEHLQAHFWMNSVAGYEAVFKREPPGYNFFIMRDFLPEKVQMLAGPPDRVEVCQNEEIWFYNKGQLDGFISLERLKLWRLMTGR